MSKLIFKNAANFFLRKNVSEKVAEKIPKKFLTKDSYLVALKFCITNIQLICLDNEKENAVNLRRKPT